ncbi:hypothetical protein [Pseudomonas extremaustralis]
MKSAQQPPVDHKERQILFIAPMVRAILSGQKTVTRRTVKPQPTLETDEWVLDAGGTGTWMGSGPSPATGGTRQTWGWANCPYGKPGDRLWVREAWVADAQVNEVAPRDLSQGEPILYPADGDMRQTGCSLIAPGKTRPSIHMPRWVCRILLEITDVRVERLQDISGDQAEAEGVDAAMCQQHLETSPSRFECKEAVIHGFAGLWQSTGGDWDTNPWVWVVEFKRVMP